MLLALIPYLVVGVVLALAAWFLPRRQPWARWIGLAGELPARAADPVLDDAAGGVTVSSLLLLVLSAAAVTSLLARHDRNLGAPAAQPRLSRLSSGRWPAASPRYRYHSLDGLSASRTTRRDEQQELEHVQGAEERQRRPDGQAGHARTTSPSPAKTQRTMRAQLWPFQANQTNSP